MHMTTLNIRTWFAAFICTLSVPYAGAAHAANASSNYANYPNRPIRMLVPNAPGSSVDTLSRIIGNKMSEVIGQQLVIDNRAGAGGIVGMEIARNAAPDGYTLISATTAASTVAVLLMKNPSFHPVNDFDHVAQFVLHRPDPHRHHRRDLRRQA